MRNISYKTGTETIRKSIAIVEVKFYDPRQCGGELVETYKIELVERKGAWLINDWYFGGGKTLSEDLKRAEY